MRTVQERSQKAKSESIPKASAELYQKYYNHYLAYLQQNSLSDGTDETAMLSYLEEVSHQWKASTMWSRVSAIKAHLILEHPTYQLPVSAKKFLTTKQKTHVPKKAAVFCQEDVHRYLRETMTKNETIMTKLALVVGIAGTFFFVLLNITQEDYEWLSYWSFCLNLLL